MAEIWNLVTSNPVVTGVVTGVGWLVSVLVTYWIGRKQTVDKIQLQRRHDLAETMAALLNRDYSNRVILKRSYEANFSHLEMREAIDAFERYKGLHEPDIQLMDQLRVGMEELQELNIKSSIYFNQKVTRGIESYIRNTRFTYASLGPILGPVDYSFKFFENLLNEQKFAELTKLHQKLVRELRRSVR